MCGIYGQIRPFNGLEGVLPLLNQSTDALYHRGPDERGTMFDGSVFLGMRRLSILDLAHGSQPVWNRQRNVCIVYNGELYNFRELRLELEGKGYCFATNSDTEVVLHAYEEWGAACLRRFNGMFAFAVWEVDRKLLFLARDRIGEKPLYYFNDSKSFIFSSEIKAILEDPSVPRCIHPQGMLNYLVSGHSMAPDTMYAGIRKLLPGHYLTISDWKEVKITQYWDVGDEPQLGPEAPRTEAAFCKEILRLLDDSVQRRMVADVPVGAFLSGGVDSSVITALMRRHASGPLKTFSLGFTVGGAYDELSDARRVANHFQTEHHELRVEEVDLVQTLRTLVYHYDEPFGDPAGFPLYLLSRFASSHVKAVLSGDGGDELFGGYRRYAVDRFATRYQRLPTPLIERWIPALAEHLPRVRRIKRALRTLPVADPATRYLSWLSVFSREMVAELVNGVPGWKGAELNDPSATMSRYYHQFRGEAKDHLNRLMYLDFKMLLADGYMEKADKATMACSLEARLPLLDHRLAELAFQIPGNLKIRGREMKRIFKRAVSQLLPAEVLAKPKHGFAVPLDPWFRGPLKQYAFEVLLDGRTRRRGYFNSDVVERLWREHSEGRHVWDSQLWLLLNFELWHRIYLDGEGV